MVKYRSRTKVRYIGDRHETIPNLIPPKGTIGTVVSNRRTTKSFPVRELWVQWPEGVTKDDGIWLVREDELEEA